MHDHSLDQNFSTDFHGAQPQRMPPPMTQRDQHDSDVLPMPTSTDSSSADRRARLRKSIRIVINEHPTADTGLASVPATTDPGAAEQRRKKSIRAVAAEHARMGPHAPTGSTLVASSGIRRRNVKLWRAVAGRAVAGKAATAQGDALDKPLQASRTGMPGAARPVFRWLRGELLGTGTYCKVYLALNVMTGEMIAAKQVEILQTSDDSALSENVLAAATLKRESEILKDLDHPNIIQYLGFEETPTYLSIFLEYVAGGSLADCLKQHGKFNDEVTSFFAGQILSGLQYLHENMIRHGNLEPKHILVEPSGVCKISGFGRAKRIDDMHAATIDSFTQVFWSPPELISSSKVAGSLKADIWSVGCIVLAMWTGQRPWHRQEAMTVVLRMFQTPQGPPVPEDFVLLQLADDFRQKCLAIDPKQRPTAAELQHHSYLELQPEWSFCGFK